MTTRNWTIFRILYLALHFLRPISSLSSHSPPDPFAYPKYSVSLSGWNDAINNLTATSILNNLHSTAHHDSLINPNSFSPNDEPNVRHTLMRTASGQAFLCALPPLPSPTPKSNSQPSNTTAEDSPSSVVEDLERKRERDQIEQEGLKNGLNLISSLKDRCIYTRLGWFTYSFCYGKGEIRQFHAQMVPGYNFPQEDPNQDVYILGFHLDHPQNPYHQARVEGTLPVPTLSAGEGELTSLGRNRFSSTGGSMLGSISDVLRDESAIRSSAVKEEEEFEQKRYLVQRWDGGTICDMTGKHRSVEVQFHCSTLGSDHIALLRETAICEYLMVIHTPRLCSEALFLDGGSRKGIDAAELVTNIECQPVLTDEEIEKWKASEDARIKKEKEDVNAQKLKSLEQTPSDEKTKTESEHVSKPDIISDEVSDQAPSEKISGVSQTQDESAPISSPDQTVLGGTESNAGQTTEQSDSEPSEIKPNKQLPHPKDKAGILEVDPITVYFDTDTGKVYVDNPAKEKQSSTSLGDSDTQPGTTTNGNNNQATNSEQKTNGRKTGSLFEQANIRDSESEFQEIAKALKESLSALLKDLRADDENEATRRPNQHKNRHQAKPRSLAEVLASLKEMDSSSSSGSKTRKPRPIDLDQSKINWENHQKVSTESHSKLVEMYQRRFDNLDHFDSDSNQPSIPTEKNHQDDDQNDAK